LPEAPPAVVWSTFWAARNRSYSPLGQVVGEMSAGGAAVDIATMKAGTAIARHDMLPSCGSDGIRKGCASSTGEVAGRAIEPLDRSVHDLPPSDLSRLASSRADLTGVPSIAQAIRPVALATAKLGP